MVSCPLVQAVLAYIEGVIPCNSAASIFGRQTVLCQLEGKGKTCLLSSITVLLQPLHCICIVFALHLHCIAKKTVHFLQSAFFIKTEGKVDKIDSGVCDSGDDDGGYADDKE